MVLSRKKERRSTKLNSLDCGEIKKMGYLSTGLLWPTDSSSAIRKNRIIVKSRNQVPKIRKLKALVYQF